jgi:hypothetical protein
MAKICNTDDNLKDCEEKRPDFFKMDISEEDAVALTELYDRGLQIEVVRPVPFMKESYEIHISKRGLEAHYYRPSGGAIPMEEFRRQFPVLSDMGFKLK